MSQLDTVETHDRKITNGKATDQGSVNTLWGNDRTIDAHRISQISGKFWMAAGMVDFYQEIDI